MSIAIFQVMDSNSTIQSIEEGINGKKITEHATTREGNEEKLETSISGVKNIRGNIHAVINYDSLVNYKDRNGDWRSVVKSNSVEVVFVRTNMIYLLIFAGNAGGIVTKISTMVFSRKEDPILSCQIRPNEMNDFLGRYTHDIKRCNWSEINLPNLNRAILLGSNMEGNRDYKRFDNHGQKNSLMVSLNTFGITISLNRGASIHFYTKIKMDQQIDFITSNILKMCK